MALPCVQRSLLPTLIITALDIDLMDGVIQVVMHTASETGAQWLYVYVMPWSDTRQLIELV